MCKTGAGTFIGYMYTTWMYIELYLVVVVKTAITVPRPFVMIWINLKGISELLEK